MGDTQNDNNLQNDDQEYINESLKEFALILYEYLMIMEKNVKQK